MRKKLQKLLGVETTYTAIVAHLSDNEKNLMLKDVKHNGKFVCDHVWVAYAKSAQDKDKGTLVTFKGVAETYRDKKNQRKLGLEKCHSFIQHNEAYVKIEHDYQNRNRRMK